MSMMVLLGLTSFEKNWGPVDFWGARDFSNLLAPWASGSRSLMLRAVSTGPLAFFSHRASDTQLLLARTGHKVFVRTTHCHIMLARPIIQRADLFPHCRDHFVRNATRLTHRSEFPCYVGDIQPLTAYPTIPMVLI